MNTKAVEYAAGLRELADWVEANPTVELPANEHSIYCTDTREEAAKVLQACTPCKKLYRENLFYVEKSFGPLTLRFVFMRNTVCTKRVVGTKFVEKKYYPGRLVEAHNEEIVEWDCDPVMEQKDVA